MDSMQRNTEDPQTNHRGKHRAAHRTTEPVTGTSLLCGWLFADSRGAALTLRPGGARYAKIDRVCREVEEQGLLPFPIPLLSSCLFSIPLPTLPIWHTAG